LVTTPHDLSIRDVIKGMDLYSELNIPILGIVENMSFFSCPCCSENTSIFGKSKLA
jgi:ATP-binding protein involved in chromosome partitioning